MPTEQILIRRVVTADRPEHYVTQREAKRKRAEKAALDALGKLPPGWYRAAEVSAQQGARSFHATAFALRRLAAQGMILEELIKVPGKHRTWEQSRVYSLVVEYQPMVVRRVSFG